MTVGLSSATYSVSEGDGFANISLQLTGAAEREVSVLVQTGIGTATGSLRNCLMMVAGDKRFLPPATSDYSAVSQDVIFSAGTTQKNVAVPIVEDSVLEAIESFSVSVTVPADNAAVVLLGTDAATINITDNDSTWSHQSHIATGICV